MNKQKIGVLKNEIMKKTKKEDGLVSYGGNRYILLEIPEGRVDYCGVWVFLAFAARFDDFLAKDCECDRYVPLYRVIWKPKKDWHPEQNRSYAPNDLSCACDWKHPYAVQSLGTFAYVVYCNNN